MVIERESKFFNRSAGYQFSLDVLLQTENGVERRRLFIEDSLTRLEWITPADHCRFNSIRKAICFDVCKPVRRRPYCAISR